MAISNGHQASTYVYSAILRNGVKRKSSVVFLVMSVLPLKHASTVEVHKVLSQSDSIGIISAMTNSVVAICVDGIRK
ncbi:hypothetical protein DVH24_018770 [Malus domestica]|uniref:Uncharacterized protein n=1 Tax=Malus domestica TaxID=3750 RepID=A0A498HPD9_MALDO|nr:hypothetical protein DVH24_018770 [Malus domestica]